MTRKKKKKGIRINGLYCKYRIFVFEKMNIWDNCKIIYGDLYIAIGILYFRYNRITYMYLLLSFQKKNKNIL